MSREQLVREAYEAWNRGDVEATLAALDPEIEWCLPAAGMNTGTFHGHDAVRGFLDSYLEVFEFFRIEPKRISEQGDEVVAHVHIAARGRGSGADVQLRPAHVWTFQGERAIRLEVVPEHDDA
jgi:ketosteroid isomerase-like protein